jgi:YidC/Oxa1 family membrane protein insertase
MDITVILFYQPIFNLIVFFYRLFGENLGFAIILIAILSRAITLPLIIKQKKSVVKNREFSDKMKGIKEKHKDNKEQREKELMALQSEYLPGQLAGCLPIILQLIFFINIYNVIINLVVKGPAAFNEYAYPFIEKFQEGYSLNYSFLGIFDLGKHPYDFVNAGLSFLPYLILMLLVGLTQYYSMKITMSMSQLIPNKTDKPKEKSNSKKEGNVAKEDFAEILQQSTKQTMLLFPILYTFLSYNFQAGLALYWIIQSGFVIIQQPLITYLETGKFKFGFKRIQKDPK